MKTCATMFVSDRASATVPLPLGPTTRAMTMLVIVADAMVDTCAPVALSTPPARWRRPGASARAGLEGDGEVSGGIGRVTVEAVSDEPRELQCRHERRRRPRAPEDPQHEVRRPQQEGSDRPAHRLHA